MSYVTSEFQCHFFSNPSTFFPHGAKKKKKVSAQILGLKKKESSPLFKAAVKVSHTGRDATAETRKLGETLVQ